MKNMRCFLLTVLTLSSCAVQALAYYHPDEGRWLSRDPMGELSFQVVSQATDEAQPDSQEYLFVRNAPADFHDPFGLQTAESLCGKCCRCTDPTSLQRIQIVEHPGRAGKFWPKLEVEWNGRCHEETTFQWLTCDRQGPGFWKSIGIGLGLTPYPRPSPNAWSWVPGSLNKSEPVINANGGDVITDVWFYYLLCEGDVWTKYKVGVSSLWHGSWYSWAANRGWRMGQPTLPHSQADAKKVPCNQEMFPPPGSRKWGSP